MGLSSFYQNILYQKPKCCEIDNPPAEMTCDAVINLRRQSLSSSFPFCKIKPRFLKFWIFLHHSLPNNNNKGTKQIEQAVTMERF